MRKPLPSLWNAVTYVQDLLSEYPIDARVHVRPLGTNRQAGRGAHELTEGSILVEAQLSPLKFGTRRSITIPVQVRNDEMIRPGVFRYKGKTFLLSKSALRYVTDDVNFPDPEDEIPDAVKPVNRDAWS